MQKFFKAGLRIALAVALFALGCSPDRKTSTVSGTIETDEARVASRYGGRVQRVLANEGDTLTNGQVIVELEADELTARRGQAAALLAELEAGPRKEEIATAKHNWETLVTERDQARLDEKRAQALFSVAATSSTERENAETRTRMLDERVASAKSQYDLLLAGTRPERIAQARAQLAEIDVNLREMTVRSPTPAVLEVLSVKPGDVLAPNREVATILLTNHLWVRVYVPEPWLGHIRIGDPVPVRVDSDPGHDYKGEVEQIAREAEFTPRNVQTVSERIKQVYGIKVRLNPADGILRAGMIADVTFPKVPR